MNGLSCWFVGDYRVFSYEFIKTKSRASQEERLFVNQINCIITILPVMVG